MYRCYCFELCTFVENMVIPALCMNKIFAAHNVFVTTLQEKPGSEVSVVGSTISTSTQKGKSRNYHIVSNTSHIDESLFDQPNHVTKGQEVLENIWAHNDNKLADMARERRVMRNKNNNEKNKDIIQIVTKDLIRNLKVPAADPSGKSIIFPRQVYHGIIQHSKVTTKEEKEVRENNAKIEKEKAMKQSAQRKTTMRGLDVVRQKNEKLSELEVEAKEVAEHLLAKANEMRQEQEDEVKYLNEIMEKGQVKREMDQEEKRLDVMMEVDRQNAVLIQEEIERKRKDDRLMGAAKILEQITGNEKEHLLELERKDQENIFMQRQVEALMDEDRMILEKKRLEQEELNHDLNKSNEEMLAHRVLKKEQEKAEELKVIEYMKQKAEREAALEKEHAYVRLQREKELAKLRALQEHAQDEQADRDARRAKRAQEQAERDWRKKEAEETWKKTETEANLIEARKNQMHQKEHLLTVQAQRERLEFERVFKIQKELMEKDKREGLEVHKNNLKHASEVRTQIQEKEHLRIADRNAFFEEGVKLDEEARLRREKLEMIKKKKLELLRNAGIPEKYLRQVERKAAAHEHISFSSS